MNINFIMQSMFITPKQAVELFNLNIDQNVSMKSFMRDNSAGVSS